MNQISMVYPAKGLPPLSESALEYIRQQINKRHKGMANRANYQDMNVAIGRALRKTNLSNDDKRQFAIDVAQSIHGHRREATKDMSVDHICDIAGVSIARPVTHYLPE